ncbi:hypothetical protein F2Q68_00016402 [Brassica cretica]|uniref:Uncharacterized protein n=1 Tax=Brassica cretica TaxID=69181 RepID=A0A8S9HHV4_BRACR|nr:hypothetical protein F2Q68_00016402 [Brassica cretica]
MEGSPYRQFSFSWNWRRFLEPIPGYPILGNLSVPKTGTRSIPRAGSPGLSTIEAGEYTQRHVSFLQSFRRAEHKSLVHKNPLTLLALSTKLLPLEWDPQSSSCSSTRILEASRGVTQLKYGPDKDLWQSFSWEMQYLAACFLIFLASIQSSGRMSFSRYRTRGVIQVLPSSIAEISSDWGSSRVLGHRLASSAPWDLSELATLEFLDESLGDRQILDHAIFLCLVHSPKTWMFSAPFDG